MKEFNPIHFKNPEFHTTEEVEKAVEKHTRLTAEKVSNTPEAKIDIFLNRLENIFFNPSKGKSIRNSRVIYRQLLDEVVIKKENFPESYFKLQERIAHEQGREIPIMDGATKEAVISQVIQEQQASLAEWVNYLASSDAVYPLWFKFFTFKNILKLSQLDKKAKKFKERTPSTVASFPEIDYEALSILYEKYKNVEDDPSLMKDKGYMDFLSKKFSSQYAETTLTLEAEFLQAGDRIEGEWRKYTQGSPDEAARLYYDVKQKRTGWCTAGLSTAQSQIKQGDFYAYFTNDEEGVPKYPRIAIRMVGEDIEEVRGTLPYQAIDPRLQDAVDAKLATFGDKAEKFKKKSTDMRMLNEIDRKTKNEEEVSPLELRFIYQLDSTIEGFGYRVYPRIKEILAARNVAKDMQKIFPDKNLVVSKQDELSIQMIDTMTDVIVRPSSYTKPTVHEKEKEPLFFEDALILQVLAKKREAREEFSLADLRLLYQFDRELMHNWEARDLIEQRDFSKDMQKLFEGKQLAFNDPFLITENTDIFFSKIDQIPPLFLDKVVQPDFFKSILFLNRLIIKLTDPDTIPTIEEAEVLYKRGKFFKAHNESSLDHLHGMPYYEELLKIREIRNNRSDLAVLYGCLPEEVVVQRAVEITNSTKIFFQSSHHVTDCYGEPIDFRDVAGQENLHNLLHIKSVLGAAHIPLHPDVEQERGIVNHTYSYTITDNEYVGSILQGEKLVSKYQVPYLQSLAKEGEFYAQLNPHDLMPVEGAYQVVHLSLSEDAKTIKEKGALYDVGKVVEVMRGLGYEAPRPLVTAAISNSALVTSSKISLSEVDLVTQDGKYHTKLYFGISASRDLDMGSYNGCTFYSLNEVTAHPENMLLFVKEIKKSN